MIDTAEEMQSQTSLISQKKRKAYIYLPLSKSSMGNKNVILECGHIALNSGCCFLTYRTAFQHVLGGFFAAYKG